MALCQRGYTFSEGQAAVWRKYLERRPERLVTLRNEIRAGRLSVMMAGETVQDSNLPTAEGLVRNFLVALPLYMVRCLDRTPRGMVWYFIKHPPCPACHGAGCASCGETGLRFAPQLTRVEVHSKLEGAIADVLRQTSGGVPVYMVVGGEETLADPCVPDVMEELNRKYAGKVNLRFATQEDVYEQVKAHLAEKEAARDDRPTADLNPAMPGCYVTRIRIKQRTRSVAYLLTAAEAVLANEVWARNEPLVQPEELTQAWRKVAFCQFHDAITGTCIDSAYVELMDMLDEAERTGKRYLPPAQALRPDVSFRTVSGTNEIRLGQMDVLFDCRGIVAINRDGKDLFKPWRHAVTLEPFRIGELTLESDYGDAWGQRIEPLCGTQNSLNLRPLGEFNDAVEISGEAIRWRGRYRGGHRKVRRLEWCVTVKASPDGERLDFETEIDWDTESKRLRVVFPVASDGDTSTYEIPFGFIDRKFDAGAMRYGLLDANAMEFPTLHWARKEIDAETGVALITRGLPCVRWMPRRFDLSLLRSPEWEFGIVEAAHYEFWDNDGQRDTGKHQFHYSLWPYTKRLSNAQLTLAGYAFNRPDFPAVPFEIRGSVVVTAWKPAEDGNGWILRLQVTEGQGTEATLVFAEDTKITMTDLLERPLAGQPSVFCNSGTAWRTQLHRHGVLTVRVVR